MATPMLTVAGADTAALIVDSIRRKFIPRLKNKLVFAPFTTPGKIEVNAGSYTQRWNLAADIGTFTTALTENTTTNENQFNTITVTSVTMTISDYGAFAYQSDLSDSVWTSETRAEWADILSYSAKKTRDTLIRDAGLATTNYFCSRDVAANTGTIATTDTAIAADLNYIRGFFDQADAEGHEAVGGNYALFIHGEVEQDMVADVTTGRLSWSPLIQYVPEGFRRISDYKGPGVLLGMAVLRTNNLGTVALTTSSTPASAAGTVTAYKCLALADHGIGATTLDQAEPRIIMKRPGPQSISVPLDTYGTIGWKFRSAFRNLDVNRALICWFAK